MGTSWERSGPTSGPVVTGFSGSGFKVDGTVHPGGVLLTPDAVAAWDAPRLDELEPRHLSALLDLQPPIEFLLLGTGPSMARPSRAFVAACEARGIGVEPMDSRAAARAWAVLRAEDRWIGAALMPLQPPSA